MKTFSLQIMKLSHHVLPRVLPSIFLLLCNSHLAGLEAFATEFGTVRKHWNEVQLELASPFADNAILQRDLPVPIWGWAQPGEKVVVQFAGQSKTTMADDQGNWQVTLDPLEASTIERELLIQCNQQRIQRGGILVGEVWFSSGQSNMDWLANKSMCRDLAAELQRSKDEIPVREYNVDIGSSIYPQKRAASKDGWKRSRQAGNFSALSLAFAYELHDQLKVPVGIIRSTHGATPIETWTPYEGFADHPGLQAIADRIRQSNPTTPEGKMAFEKYFDDLRNWQQQSADLIKRGGAALVRPKLPGIAEDWKGPSRMFNKKVAPLIPYSIRGVIWCQGTSNAGDGKIYAAKMEALVNGLRKTWGRPKLPFYFTQMQCYGEPDPNQVGFADIREAQTLFFLGSKNVGMVPQYDLNPERPTGIHYHNKLDPGKRMARWALAHQYDRKELAFTGPIYKSHAIDGDTVRVTFEQRGPGGMLMVGSKGQESDAKKSPGAYVEPARRTKDAALTHFRLAGADKVWHPAKAMIEGNVVVVRSANVPKPKGVQYAYSASPIGANLYNEAGLPAIPFAYFDGRQMFNEDDPNIVAAAKAEAERKWGKKTYLLPSTLLRDRAVLQRGKPVPIWGHGVPGTEITVEFGEQKKTTRVGEFERWSVTLDSLPPSTKPRDLVISSNIGELRTIKDVLVGDVWVMTGTRQLASELVRPAKGESSVDLEPLEWVREFRIKTKARRFRTPRKLKIEIGGGKYVASWQPADFDDVGDPPSVAAYFFASKIRQAGIPLGIVTLGAENPPLTWVSPNAMQTAVGFEKERDNLNLADPSSKVCRQAVKDYVKTIRDYNKKVAAVLNSNREVPLEWSDSAPAFPEPFYDQWASRTETSTHTYNFCISPLVPYAIKGVTWIPGKENISSDPTRYGPALDVFADNLSTTFEQSKVEFLFADPSAELVPDVQRPKIGNPRIQLNEWPKSLKSAAEELGELAKSIKD